MNLTDIVKLWEVFQVFHRYTTFQKVTLVLGLPIALYVIYLITLGRPPLIAHQLRFFLLQDRQVRSFPNVGNTFEMEFRLLNSTSPPEEVNNVFGHIWIDSGHFLSATIVPSRPVGENGRVEWDINIATFPKEGVFLPTKILTKMPDPGDEVRVGAQFVSKQTERVEYLWSIVNDNGVPKTVVQKGPDSK